MRAVFSLRLVLVTAALASGACVSSGTHKATLADLEKSRKSEAELKAEVARLNDDITRLQASVSDERKKNDDATALVAELKGRLEKLGQNVEQLSGEKGQLAAGLEQANTRLEELRRQKAAAEARAATFRTLVQKLRSMIDAGTIKVTIRNGRMLIALPNDVLFDSGKTQVKTEGQAAIAQVAQALSAIGDRRFLVAGHSDNVPIKTSRFPSNWELSSARAIEVVHLLVGAGMHPQKLGAAGYGEFDPVSANDSDVNRAANRRIEIVLEPNLSDLPSLDGVADGAAPAAVN
jgi:chemotaxis protein MotB